MTTDWVITIAVSASLLMVAYGWMRYLLQRKP